MDFKGAEEMVLYSERIKYGAEKIVHYTELSQFYWDFGLVYSPRYVPGQKGLARIEKILFLEGPSEDR